MWEVADRIFASSRREMAKEIDQLNALVNEQKTFISELKEALRDAREKR